MKRNRHRKIRNKKDKGNQERNNNSEEMGKDGTKPLDLADLYLVSSAYRANNAVASGEILCNISIYSA